MCYENKKSFLFFHWYGPHRWRVLSLKRFMKGNKDFIVVWKCFLCGDEWDEHFVESSRARHLGFTPDQLCRADYGEVSANENA